MLHTCDTNEFLLGFPSAFLHTHTLVPLVQNRSVREGTEYAGGEGICPTRFVSSVHGQTILDIGHSFLGIVFHIT